LNEAQERDKVADRDQGSVQSQTDRRRAAGHEPSSIDLNCRKVTVMASLVSLKGSDQGKWFPLDRDRMSMGRSADCHVVVPGTSVSREHAYIVRSGDAFFIEDNMSRNGTYINNQKITQRTLLREHDRIKICDCLYRFHENSNRNREEMRSETEPEILEDRDGPFKPEASLSHTSTSLDSHRAPPA
jgi:hypothetical protein